MMRYILILGLLLSGSVAIAQAPNGNSQVSVSVREALQWIEQNYPSLKVKILDAESSRQNIALVKNTLVPSLDASYQVGFATYNNITGLYYPQDILPISGPPSITNNYSPAGGSAGSLYLTWQPITFGQRTAQVNLAKAELSSRNSDALNEIFKHQLNLLSAYLDVLVNFEVAKVFENNLERTDYNLQMSHTLALSGMRPGVDTALFAAEHSKARIDLLNIQNSLAVQRITLSQFMGTDSLAIQLDTFFFSHLPLVGESGSGAGNHPLYKLLSSELVFQQERRKTIWLDVMPKLNFWGIAYGRGSGAGLSGGPEISEGFNFTRYNYGVGAQLTLPLLHFTEVRLKYKQQQYVVRASEERLNQVELDLRKQQEIADTTYLNSLGILKEAAIQVDAANYAFDAMQHRYEAGLSNYADLIQAQYILMKSETELKKSYWSIWRALLNQAAARGDINIFLSKLQ